MCYVHAAGDIFGVFRALSKILHIKNNFRSTKENSYILLHGKLIKSAEKLPTIPYFTARTTSPPHINPVHHSSSFHQVDNVASVHLHWHPMTICRVSVPRPSSTSYLIPKPLRKKPPSDPPPSRARPDAHLMQFHRRMAILSYLPEEMYAQPIS